MPKPLFSTLLVLCLCAGGITLAIEKPETQPAATKVADEAGKRLAAETLAAIRALGAKPSAKQISAIVFKAVRSSPEHVLVIVDAASRVSPKTAVPGIVRAATSAVPNPWKQVIYRRLAAVKVEEPSADSADGGQMPLAEAIARTAFDAQSGLVLRDLFAAVDAALLTDPGTLLRNIQSSRAASGVGDAGLSNYANEPLRTPKQPAVSR